jgi:DNA-binding NtrC family response regulator
MMNVMQRLVVLASGARIEAADVEAAVALPAGGAGAEDDGPTLLAEVERRHILKVLAAKGGRKGDAALALGIDRKTLRQKLAKYQIEG